MTPGRRHSDVQAAALSRFEWFWWVMLFIVVTLLWCVAYDRWTIAGWKVPIAYNGDALFVMGITKAFSSGEVIPFVPRYPASLGAPFVANWNDYPLGVAVFTWCGLLARLFGLFAGSNLMVLSAHLLAAGSFYFVTRKLGYQRVLAVSAAVLFSTSCFAFDRHLSHLGPLLYWHVPLGLLVARWCGREPAMVDDRRRTGFCFAVAVLHGLQDPYYSGIFLQFLVLASVACLIRRQPARRVLFPLLLAMAVLATHALMMVNVFYSRVVDGPNPAALVRNYAGLELYALKPIELLVPYPHRIVTLHAWAKSAYVDRVLIHGEIGSAYLGFVGIAGLCALVWSAIRATIGKRADQIPIHFWGILWVLGYSVVGGLNGLIGLFGITVFRGTNRYSIVILALALLFLVRQLTVFTRNWRWLPVSAIAAFIMLLGFLDQSRPLPSAREVSKIREQIESDGKIVSTLEARLPLGAMIFEMPIHEFPEAGSVRGMEDGEHFRPYFQARALRFSYGTVKGRTRERWQKEAELFGPAHLFTILERYGFSAVIINKKAYEESAAAVVSALSSFGRSEVICESSDFIAVRLQPSSQPILPPEFTESWYGLEGDVNNNWRWSRGDATLILHNPGATTKSMRLSFSLVALKAGTVEILNGPQKLQTQSLAANQNPTPVELTVPLSPGKTEIRFNTNIRADLPGNGDPRKLAFNLTNFRIVE